MATVEPEGESCGTAYDDRSACVCGVPTRQLGPLRLRVARIPRGVHLARTIADEFVISAELLAQLNENGISFQTAPLLVPNEASPDPNWRQLVTSVGDLEISRRLALVTVHSTRTPLDSIGAPPDAFSD